MRDNCPRCNCELFVKDNTAKYVLCVNLDCLWYYPVDAYWELKYILNGNYIEVVE